MCGRFGRAEAGSPGTLSGRLMTGLTQCGIRGLLVGECSEQKSSPFHGLDRGRAGRLLDCRGYLAEERRADRTDRLGGHEIIVLIHLDAIELIENDPAWGFEPNAPALDFRDSKRKLAVERRPGGKRKEKHDIRIAGCFDDDADWARFPAGFLALLSFAMPEI